jgi:small subunit ribosomal protein S2e
MADSAPSGGDRGGFGRGGKGEGGKGKGKGKGKGGKGKGKGKGGKGDDEWIPCTRLGRLVKAGKIRSLEQVYLYALPLKESPIVEYFLKDALKDEVMCLAPVQKQTTAGQRTRFKAFVACGDNNGHVGLGWKCHKEVAGAIGGALIAAKLNTIPIRRGYWGKKSGLPHTVPVKVTGKCGSCRVRLIPAPRGTGLVASPVPKKVLTLAGIEDCYTSSRGHTRTMGNMVKAVFSALKSTYTYLTPLDWKPTNYGQGPYQEHTDWLAKEGAAKSS